MIDIDGVDYDVNYGLVKELITESGFDGSLIFKTKPPFMIPVNQCDHCHRADWKQRIAGSVEEAIEFGWLVKVDE